MTLHDPDPTRADALSRSERKGVARKTLLNAALALVGEGRSFTSLALREIARQAGMVPNAFYRHFRNTDDLGLELVEEVGITLRRLLREARQVEPGSTDLLRRSVRVYLAYIRANRLQFLFISSERSGGSRVLRMAIRNDVTHFTSDMAQDFRALGLYKDLPTARLQMVCGLIVMTMLSAATDILDLPPDQPLLEHEMAENFVRQLQIILIGAQHWRERSRPRPLKA
ncbi:MAG: TetR family transcriptional regulator [Pseudomonadota bacterium]